MGYSKNRPFVKVDVTGEVDKRFDEVTSQLAETTEKADLNFETRPYMFFDDSGHLDEKMQYITDNSGYGYVAFTAIIKFGGQFIVFYRRGTGHVSFDGEIVYKTSSDGEAWSQETVLLSTTDYDYRDPCVIVFNGKLVLKYVWRLEIDSVSRTSIISTDDLITWTDEQILPSPNGDYARSRGNMAIKDGELYVINYLLTNNTFLLKTTDLVNWSIVMADLKTETNEASIIYSGGKFIAVFRQKKSGVGEYEQPLLFGESIDGLNWSFKELEIKGHCPSLHLIEEDRYLITYRETESSLITNKFHYVMTVLNKHGELTSIIYDLLWSTSWNIGYGDILIDGTNLYAVYYGNSNIFKKKFILDDVQKLNLFKPTISTDKFVSNEVKYLNKDGVITLAPTKTIMGDVDVVGNGTKETGFTVDLSLLGIVNSVVVVTNMIADNNIGNFNVTLISVSQTQIVGRLLLIGGGAFSSAASIKIHWEINVRS